MNHLYIVLDIKMDTSLNSHGLYRSSVMSNVQCDSRADARCGVLAWALPPGQGQVRHHQVQYSTVQYSTGYSTVRHFQVPQDRAEKEVQLQEEEQPCGEPHWRLWYLLHSTLQTKQLQKRCKDENWIHDWIFRPHIVDVDNQSWETEILLFW